jgi:UDP-3-O-acyl N-acetylglucosamine deacetylase
MDQVGVPRPQRTIRRPVAVDGVGYWSGCRNRVELRPAPAGAGVTFVRRDLDPAVRIPARLAHRLDATNRTNLAVGSASVEMVEHVLSALAGLGVDCCEVSVEASELPGLDGSSHSFVEAIDSVGVEVVGAPCDPIVVDHGFRVEDGRGWVEFSPPVFAGLSVEYLLDYGDGPIGRQRCAVDVTPDAYRAELARARTFLGVEDADRLRASGRGLHVAIGDLLVFGPDGPIGNALRWPDECARHKALDVVGDLALAGRPIHASVRASRSGHRLNAMAVGRLLAGAPSAARRRSA